MGIQSASGYQPNSVLESTFIREAVTQEISMAVLKQVQQSQENQAQALVQMIQQSTPQGTGKVINILA